MRSTRALLLLCVVLVAYGAAPFPVRSDEPVFEPAPLRRIEVEGLRRTRETVVRDVIALQPGDIVTAAQVEIVEDDIVDTDLFADVSVITRRPPEAPGEVDLLITVREKWTLIPLPFFATDGSSFSGGLVLLESNLLGRNKQLITAAFAGSDGFRGFFAYADPSIRGGSWTGRASAATGDSERTNELPDGSRLRRFTIRRTSVAGGLGYRFSRAFRIDTGLRATTRDVNDFRAGIDDRPPEDGVFLEPNLTFRYDGSRPRGVLRVGPDVQGTSRLVLHGGDPGTDMGWEVTVQAGLSIPVPVPDRSRARLQVSGGVAELSPVDSRELSARDGFRTLPYQTSVADRWGGGAVFYDAPVLNPSWGSIVLTHYWEGGVFDADIHDRQFFGGPGGGFRVYLQEVAIPALGLDVAYNMVDPGVVFSFSLGMQM